MRYARRRRIVEGAVHVVLMLGAFSAAFSACTGLHSPPSTPQLDAEVRTCNQTDTPYGCGTFVLTRHILKAIRSQATPLPGLPPVAVYGVRDARREAEPNRLGTALKHPSAKAEALYSDEPVASTVSRVMTVVLLSRGFPVIDLRRTVYDPHNVLPDARFAITGELQEFWSTYAASSRRVTSIVKVQVRVHDAEHGEIVWEKSYSSSCTGTPGWDPCGWLTALEAVSLLMTKDPALVEEMQRRRATSRTAGQTANPLHRYEPAAPR
jgi:hypothetical protein